MFGTGFGELLTSTEGGASDGFFASITQGLGAGIGKVLSDVAPVWAANQLGVQQADTNAAPTFNRDAAPPRVDQAAAGATGNPPVIQKTGLLFDNVNISAGGVIAIAAAIVAVVLVLRA